MPELHDAIELRARIIEVTGVAVMALGIVTATALFMKRGLGSRAWGPAYDSYRANFGRRA